MNRFCLVLALSSTFAVTLFASANAQLVYSNGPINGSIDAATISGTFQVSDSFIVSSAANLASVTAGIWDTPGNSATSMGWEIGTAAFGSDISSGSSPTTDVFQYTNIFGAGIYADSFAVSGAVTPGTYWLTLLNAVSTTGSNTFWDDNNGPSTGEQNNGSGTLASSQSFQIFATAAGTPEPGAYAMLCGLGLSALTIARRRRRG